MAHRLPLLIFLILALAISAPASADVADTGSGGVIPDNINTGVVSTITITDAQIIQNASFGIQGLTHTWVGDLAATVIHIDTLGNQTNARLFFRTGKASSSGPGDASDLAGDYTFSDTALGDWWAAAGAAGNGQGDMLAPGAYRASGTFGGFIDLDTAFGGQSTEGTWTLRLSDLNPVETGSFSGWNLALTSAVPEPTSALAIFGASVFFLRRRRSA